MNNNNNNKCTLLPDKIANKVIKVQLNSDESETARAILIIPAGSEVYDHSHEKDKNPDSEVYINLLEMLNLGIDNINQLPEVAGSNSPTKTIEHGIHQSSDSKVILAIKKGQEEGLWNNLNNNYEEYFNNLGVIVNKDKDKDSNIIKVISKVQEREEEVITVDIERNSVTYYNRFCFRI